MNFIPYFEVFISFFFEKHRVPNVEFDFLGLERNVCSYGDSSISFIWNSVLRRFG